MIRAMKPRLAALVVLALATALPATARESAHGRALRVVSRMMLALGGPQVPYRADLIAFTFAVERDGAIAGQRRHVWRPRSGDHRVRYTPGEGGEIVIDWNIHTRTGEATQGGYPVEGEDLAKLLEQAAQMWVNDTYWLLMPYKLLDPGVNLTWDREEMIGDMAYDVIRVAFGDVGFTPGDTYWAYISRKTGLMERWAYVLEGREPPPTAWDWTETAHYGPLLLSRRKQRDGAAQAILTHQLVVW